MKLIEYEQPTSVPVPKVAAGGIAGVGITALVTILGMSGVIVPDGVSSAAVAAVGGVIALVSAVQTIVSFLAAYYKKDKKTVEAVQAIQSTADTDVRG